MFGVFNFISERSLSFVMLIFLPEGDLSSARNNHSLNCLLCLGCNRKICAKTKAPKIKRAAPTLSFVDRITLRAQQYK